MPKIRINNPIQFATTPLGSRSEYLDLLEKKYDIKKYVCTVDILFSSNHNMHKSSSGLCFWASDPLIERF